MEQCNIKIYNKDTEANLKRNETSPYIFVSLSLAVFRSINKILLKKNSYVSILRLHFGVARKFQLPVVIIDESCRVGNELSKRLDRTTTHQTRTKSAHMTSLIRE